MKKAYIVVDMNNDFVADDGSLTLGKTGQVLVEKQVKRAQEFLNNGDVVVFCNDCHQKDDEHFKMWPPHCVDGTKGELLYGALNDFYEKNKHHNHVIYIKKSEYDAFYKTTLSQQLKELNVDEVYICGVCTDICVFNTVYGAYKEGFKTNVYKDECATFTGNHDIFINQMAAIYKTNII